MEGIIFLRTRQAFSLQLVLRQTLGLEENSMTDWQREQIRILRLQGVSYVKIGEQLGISDNTVRSFCRRSGLGDSAKNAVACKQFGGITGDLAGWFLQKTEIWMLAALCACQWGGQL